MLIFILKIFTSYRVAPFSLLLKCNNIFNQGYQGCANGFIQPEPHSVLAVHWLPSTMTPLIHRCQAEVMFSVYHSSKKGDWSVPSASLLSLAVDLTQIPCTLYVNHMDTI